MDGRELIAMAEGAGFAGAALCSAEVFAAEQEVVKSQEKLRERRQLRFDPTAEYPWVKSLLVLLWPYVPREAAEGCLFVDGYYRASNEAYHAARKLEEMLTQRGVCCKANVSYPAKEAACRAGLGIIGKNSLLITKEYGTRVVIILMATDVEAEQKKRRIEGCISCGRCVKACPSGALDEQGMTNPQRCLRNYMLEGIVVPDELREKMGNRLIGCDICQRVCPMQPDVQTQTNCAYRLDDYLTDDAAAFSEAVSALADEIGRNAARPQRVRAQAALLAGIRADANDLPVLKTWSQSSFEAVQAHALWAMKRIREKHG